jgi:outer membrane protein assembly factor BamA
VKKFALILLLFIGALILPSESFSQTIIGSISFEGNAVFSKSELLLSMVSQKDNTFSKEQFQLDIYSIRDKYKSAGFLYAQITKTDLTYSADSSVVEILIKISEGDKITIGKIIFIGNQKLSDKEILSEFDTKAGDVLSDNILNADIQNLLLRYEKMGLPFARIKIRDISVYSDENKSDKICVSIEIAEESSIVIDKVKIVGTEVTNDDVILRELKIGKDNKITVDAISNFKSRLEKLYIFDKVEEPKIYRTMNKNSAVLVVEVKEGNLNTFDGVLGYVPPANDNENGYLTGLINLTFKNIFGTGRRIDAKWQQPVKTTQELEFKYAEPYIFKFPLNLNLGFMQRIQDSTYTRRKLDLKGDFLFSDKFTISFVGSYDRVIPSTELTGIYYLSDSRIFSSGMELKFDSRDNIFIPGKGFLYRIFYSYGDKKTFNSSAVSNQQSYSIQKYWMDLEFYSSFWKRQTAMIKIFGGEVRSDKLEDADFFRIGGSHYIRGYRDEQFLSSKLLSGNIEIRYSYSRKGFFFAFWDNGYYFKNADALNNLPEQEGYIYGFGLGMRLETGLGIIGVNYALGKGDGLLDGKINFGLITDF